jgi:hypothetical protein
VNHASRGVVPFSFDLSLLAPRTVATLYSHLVTRPTGRALRLGIESQIGELGGHCVSILDFTQVVVLDYSCADEAVAKLLQRYCGGDPPADVYFMARGLGEQHREPIEAVLVRHGLALVAQVEGGAILLGDVTALERTVWLALQRIGRAQAAEIAATIGRESGEIRIALDGLTSRRVIFHQPPARYWALSALVAPDDPERTAADG